MFKNFSLISLVLLFILLGVSHARETKPSTSILNDQSLEVTYINNKTNKPHSKATLSVSKKIKDKVYYDLFIEGEGNYGKYKNVQWTKEARMVERKNFLFVLNSKMKIYTQNKFPLVEYHKHYDYRAQKAIFQTVNNNGTILQEKEFPIKGPICDYITMSQFLKTFYVNRGKKEFRKFYLISNEPKLYHVTMKEKKKELLELPVGKVNATKFQLMADLGPLTEVAAKFLPPTFIWYSDETPHKWVQYEGLDSGPKSINVKAYLSGQLNE